MVKKASSKSTVKKSIKVAKSRESAKASKQKTILSKPGKAADAIRPSRPVKPGKIFKSGRTQVEASKSEKSKKETKRVTVYKKGAKVVYPMHGVGIIDEIKNITILGEEKNVYVINIVNNCMTVMIPKKNVDKVGIRSVISQKEVEKVLKILKDKETEMEEDWKLRYQINMEKVKTGSIYEVAEVARNLYRRSLDKDLSIMERKLYENAYQLITNEIALARNLDIEDAGNIISEVLS